ncbi:MAG: helix-turn-helix domain-containing protein [Gammaproteobacteria bacterium]|jgi:DNA-binding transcriptional regulator YdaS (Cro superfamily)|nr:helix-turn-helix domain-containing protein [Gammaproteobacteria bacterium]
MNLQQYCQLHTQATLARSLGVTPGMIYQWLSGRRRIGAETAVRIEQATQGAIPRWELRPDLWERPTSPQGMERK